MSFFRALALFLLSFFCVTFDGHAQRIIGELESNTDMSMMNPTDTTSSDKKGSKKSVPVDVRTWTIDPIFGNRTPTYVDTLHHQFQNNDHSEGMNGEYNTLANLGSPRLSRIYMNREGEAQLIYVNAFDQFIVKPENFRYYSTKSPYVNLTYNWCGSKQTGSDHFRAIYTQSAGKRFNMGGIFDYMYGQGYYDNQSTAFMNATGFASYTGERYDFHFHYTHNYMKMAENGGIENDLYITNPESQQRSYGSDEIPVNLANTWTRQEHDVIFFNHRYHIGFVRPADDSLHIDEAFVPVTSFFHTFNLTNYRRKYIAYSRQPQFHSYSFLPGDSANDFHKSIAMKNIVGVSLNEGFNKYAVAGINAYVGFEHIKHEMPDTLPGVQEATGRGRRTMSHYNENNILIGGQLIRTQGTMVHYDVQAELVVAGDEAGNIDLEGEGELNLPLLGDTAQVVIGGLFSRTKPTFYYENFHSKHAWWDNEFSSITQTRLTGTISLPRTKTRLKVGVENIQNYTYLANNGIAVEGTESGTTVISNNIVARQCSDNIQIISATLHQDFRLGKLHFDNEITYQTSTNEDVLPLPTLSTYHNLYLQFRIAKVLDCELGADAIYFSSYYAPDYSPVLSNFTTQHPDKRIKIGNYPIVSLYANLHLKRCRFYLQYYHFNQSEGRYFWAPHYPVNPKGLHFGISWNFYD